MSGTYTGAHFVPVHVASRGDRDLQQRRHVICDCNTCQRTLLSNPLEAVLDIPYCTRQRTAVAAYT